MSKMFASFARKRESMKTLASTDPPYSTSESDTSMNEPSINRPFHMFLLSTALIGASLSLVGCHSQPVKRSLSPLIGIWQISGSAPAPDPNKPRFTKLHFDRDGSLDATYVVATGALTGLVKTTPKLAQEQDRFVLLGQNHLRIIEGSRALEYRYDVHDGKLFLRASGSDESTVYTHLHPSDDSETSGTSDSSDSITTPPAAQQ